MASLGRQARRHGAQLRESGSHWQRGRRGRPAPQPDQAARQVLLPCVLSRGAMDRASALLMLEADLRGRPELHALLHSSGWTWPAEAGAAGAHAGHLGRHNEQHALWRRLERSLAQAMGGGEGADGQAEGEQPRQPAATGGSRREQRRHRQGRSLSAEERLVLGILSNPRFDFEARTALPV